MKSFAKFLVPMALLASCGTAPSSNNGSISNESQPSDNRVSSIENEYDDPSLPADYKEFMALKDQALALWNENKVGNYTEDPIYYDFIDVDDDGNRIEIKDNGIGIPKKDIKNIFNKSFTGSNGRNKTKSTGMGLYIVNNLIKLNN